MKQGKAGIRKDSWLNWQDEKLTEIIMDHARRGLKQKDAMKTASLAIGKSESACAMRWHTNTKDKVKKLFTLPPEGQEEQRTHEEPTEQSIEIQPDISIERAGKKWRLMIEANGNDQTAVDRILAIFREFTGGKEIGA